jgi:outer membrane protein assembly factor BamB
MKCRPILSVLVALLILAAHAQLAIAQDQGGVPMFHGDAAHTGQQPGPAPEGPPVQRWIFETGGAVRSSPAVVDGVVYFGSRDRSLYAINAETGAEIWSFATGGAIVTSPAVVEGRVFTTSFDGFLYALDAVSGEELWRFRSGAATSPTVAGGTVFLGTNDGAMYAIDAQTGIVRWSAAYETDEVGTPSVAGQTVIVGAGQHMYAYEASTGRLRWTYDAGGPVAVAPAISGGLAVFLAAAVSESQAPVSLERQPTTEAMEGDSGTQAGRNQGPDEPSGEDPSTRVRITRGAVVALDTETGELQWRWNFPADRASFSVPAITGGIAIVATENGFVNAIDTVSGTQRWGYRTGGALTSSPAVTDTLVVVGSYDGLLYALNTATGAAAWTFPTGGFIHSSPAVVDGVVYVGSDDGALYAITGS